MSTSGTDLTELLARVAETIAAARRPPGTPTDQVPAANYAAAVERAVAAQGVGDTDAPENAPWHREALLQLVGGAREVAGLLRGLELEAARQARHAGVTVGELAAEVGISVRAANDRYRKVKVFNPDSAAPFKWDPADAEPSALAAPAGRQRQPSRDDEQDDDDKQDDQA